MSKILIKMPVKPHRQKILTEEGEEMRLQQWANKKAAKELGSLGADIQGEQFESSRNTLMRDAVENPETHNIKFFNDIVPFDEEPNAADEEIGQMHQLEEELTHGKDESEIDRDEIDRQIDEKFGSTTINQPLSTRQTTLEDFSTKAYTSRKIAFDDAWNILKALPEQQMYFRAPHLRNTRSRRGGDRSATVHPAIEGILSRNEPPLRDGNVNLNLQPGNPLSASPVLDQPEFVPTQRPSIGSLQDDFDSEFAHRVRERNKEKYPELQNVDEEKIRRLVQQKKDGLF